MKMKRSRTFGRIFLALAALAVLLFLGCGILKKPISAPSPPKPETSETISTAQKTASEMTPAVPVPPSPPAGQPFKPSPPLETKPVPTREVEPAPKAEPAAPGGQDPISSGDVLLNPSVSDDAKTIQGRFAELGLYTGAVDGIWGRGSRAALRKFKQQNSLRNPDKWDKATQIALFKKDRQAGQAAAPSSQDPLASGAVFLNSSNPDDAQTIQGRLAELGFYTGGIDGIWGRGSRAALREFKEKNNLPNPDKWDKETQIFLFRETSK